MMIYCWLAQHIQDKKTPQILIVGIGWYIAPKWKLCLSGTEEKDRLIGE